MWILRHTRGCDAMGRWRQRLKCRTHKPRNAKDGQPPPEAERGKEVFSLSLWRTNEPANTLILDFWFPTYEIIHFHCAELPSL